MKKSEWKRQGKKNRRIERKLSGECEGSLELLERRDGRRRNTLEKIMKIKLNMAEQKAYRQVSQNNVSAFDEQWNKSLLFNFQNFSYF